MQRLQKIVRNNRVVQNAGWLISGKIIQMVINLFVGLYTARYLGPSYYGLINYGQAYTAFFLSMCTLGINSVLVKELIEHKEQNGVVIGTSLILKGIASLLSSLMIFCIVSIVDCGKSETIIVVSLCSIGLIFNVLDTFNYWFQSRLESKVTAICSLIAFSVTATYKLYLLVNSKSVVYFAFATSIDYICIGILLFIFYKKHGGEQLQFSWHYAKQLLKSSTPFILPSIMVAVYGQTDKIMLKQMIDEAEIGYYSTAVSICSIWGFVVAAIIDSLVPPIMEAYSTDKESFIRKNKLLYSIVFYLCIIISVVVSILSGFIVNTLYGQAYLPTVAPLRIITWYTAFVYLGVARNAWIVCNNKQRKLKYVYFGAALANVVLNYILIPSMGASGAALASLLAQALTAIGIPFFMPSLKENSLLMIDSICLKDVIPERRK